MFLLCISMWQKKPTILTVNSAVWMFLDVKKAFLRRSYVNACCSFPLPKLSGVFDKSEVKKKTQTNPMWVLNTSLLHKSMVVGEPSFFAFSTCPLLAQERFLQTCQYKLEFALKFIWLKCLGTPQGLPHSHYIQGLRKESGKDIFKKRCLRMIVLTLGVKYNLVVL